ncbi:hypothetical protein NLI96_g12782 [Meripilus lineatus]|uniref:Uncharacterized protein n=1 Tax=Meripilus lineatus TaxID=2056292 RepID=A0AAD5UPG1_9APHY|nr:hypothetical protein NLI96_g12782 [Physisporinus lineatus]
MLGDTSSQLTPAVLNPLAEALSQQPRDPKNCHIVQVKQIARWMAWAISPFLDLKTTLKVGLFSEGKLRTTKKGEVYLNPHADMEHGSHTNHIKLYQKILHGKPKMREFLDWYENDAERLDILATFMNFHIHQMRGEDICSLRNKVFAYAGKNGTRANFGGHGASKQSRGFNNPDSGRLNCPMRDITEFDDEGWMAYRDRVDKEDKIVDENDWPLNVYEESLYDPDNLDAGLMQGGFVMSVTRQIATGPRTAHAENDGPLKGRPPKVAIHSQVEITPELIAYSAVLARFSVSSENSWSGLDKWFNYENYFNNIMELFANASEDGTNWDTNVLELYNKRIFGPKAKSPVSRETRPDSDRERQKRQRALRRTQGIPRSSANISGPSTSSPS